MDDVDAPDPPMPAAPMPDDRADELPGYDVPELPETGDRAVDEAVLRLTAATQEPLETQVTAFDAAHRALQDRLADVES